MMRQRRYSKNQNLSNSLNYYANENFSLLAASVEPNNFYPSQPVEHSKPRRNGLVQITQDNNCRIEPNDLYQTGKQTSNIFTFKQANHKEGVIFKNRQNDNLFTKINELIRQEDAGIPVCHSFKNGKAVVNRHKDRPYTSLSLRNKIICDNSLPKGPVVLDFTPKQQHQIFNDNGKISTSRALMNYSKVYRNSSGDRFKVKRDKQYFRNFALVSAHKVVLQQKLKKEKKDLILWRKQDSSQMRRKSQTKLQKPKNRYSEEKEEFQIEGWEYFD